MRNKLLRDTFILIVLAFACTVIAINGKTAFYIPGDGSIHLSRYEQVFQSLKHGAVPSEVSFIIPGHSLSAFMSCYPWLSGVMFVLPRFVLKNVVISIAVSFFIVNFLTAFNIYYLGKKLSSNKYGIFLGVVIYLFNSYHLILLYGRMAFGEFLAYAFLPLVVVGFLMTIKSPLLEANQYKKYSGLICLTIGMSAIANSHFISLAVASFFIVACTIILVLQRKITLASLLQIALAGLLSFILSFYSLFSLLKIESLNSIIMPFKSLIALNLKLSTIAQLKLIISEAPLAWNLGIICSLLLAFLLVASFKSELKRMRIWIWSAFLFLLLSYIPFNSLPKHEKLVSMFGVIQFQGRLLAYAALTLSIAFLIYTRQTKIHKGMVYLTTVAMIVCATIGVIKLEKHKMPAPFETITNAYYILSNDNYHNNIYNSSNNCIDYLPGYGTVGNGRIYTHGNPNVTMQWLDSTYNSVTFRIVSAKSTKYPINIGYYKGINYNILLNNKPVPNLSKKQFFMMIPKGTSLLKVKLSPTLITKGIFWQTVLSNIVFFIGVVYYVLPKEVKQSVTRNC